MCICESWDWLSSMRIGLLSHGFDTDAPLIGEKHENLVRWIVIGGRKEVELVPAEKRGRVSLVSVVFRSRKEQESNILDETHLIRVHLSELCKFHLDFFVRDLESLASKEKSSQV